jgi:pimeloyl-ACP methyl ester carboxylesterase
VKKQIYGGWVDIGDGVIDYVVFGRGEKNLVILPGLSDGIKTVKGMASFFALSYREYGEDYRVYVFSRRRQLKAGCTTRDMAQDQAKAMERLGLYHAEVMGISQGGMIAQWLAIDHPRLVHRLVLSVTLARPSETEKEVIRCRMNMVRQKRYGELIIDTIEKACIEEHCRIYRHVYPMLKKMRIPVDDRRFLIQAQSCMEHYTYDDLDRIQCPTLIIGGEDDRTVGLGGSLELSEKIKDSTLHIYPGVGHAIFEAGKDLNCRIMTFLGEK